MSRRPFQKRGCKRRRGFSLVEVAVSSLLVGLVLVGAMDCLGGVIRGHMNTSNAGRGPLLAGQLMTEILSQSYEEPVDPPTFGRESPESGVNRLVWDDVDDYDGWSATPPEYRNGNVIFNASGWQRDVTVELIDPTDPATVSGTDQGLKRITITVQHNGQVVTRLVALRSDKYTIP